MKFGPVATDEALGAILAHAVRHPPDLVLAKGKRLDGSDILRLKAIGIERLTVARPEPGDVAEDAAAARAARGLAGTGVGAAEAFTGRVNLHAEAHGVLTLDRDAIDRLNRLDETVTVATLPPFAVVRPRQIVATVKIIPYAAPETVIAAWEAAATPLSVAPFRPRRAALIQTSLPGQKASILAKLTASMTARLEALGSTLAAETRVAHETQAVAAAIRDHLAAGAEMILIGGASAIIDRGDVIPEAIRAAGGTIDHFGMPVDPGNLFLLGHIGAVPVLGLPGCARSPRPNGVDFVLHRLLAGLPIGAAEIMAMGVGGLLTETTARPLPRAETAAPAMPRIAAIILAAGRSSRMGVNKLLIETEKGALIRHAVEAALASQARPVLVVTGRDGAALRAALAGYDVRFVDNPDFAAGLSTSLAKGLAALPETADGAVICLGDMPDIGATLIDRLIAAYSPLEGRAIIVPMRNGRRGNPVLWGRRFFAELQGLTGDVGGRRIIERHDDWVADIAAPDDGVLTDIDTPGALEQWRLLNAYRASDYRAGDAVARIDARSADIDALLDRHGAARGAFVTAWNPASRPTPAAANQAATARLAAAIAERGFQALPARFQSRDAAWTEEGFLILGIAPDDAIALAESFGQNAIVLVAKATPARLARTGLWPVEGTIS